MCTTRKRALWMLVCALIALPCAGSEADDFSSFFESLFSEDDNPLLDMLSGSTKKDQKTTPAPSTKEAAKPTNPMPSPEQYAAFEARLQELLIPLEALIKHIHFHHKVLGGSVYERIRHLRKPMIELESTLLHIESIAHLLPLKNLEPFSKSLEKNTPAVVTLLNDILLQAYRPVATSIDQENAFIMGKTRQSPVFIPLAQRKKLESKINQLVIKLKPIQAELSKLFTSPDLKKLFPETPTKKTKSYAPTSSSGRSSAAPYKPASSASRGKSPSYNDNYYNPYSSPYSSYDYPYDDNTPDDFDTNKEPSKPTEPPPGAGPLPQKDLPHQQTFAELVEQLQEHETVATLRAAAQNDSMLSAPEYFGRMASLFESLFRQSPDGGFASLTQLFKKVEETREHDDAEAKKSDKKKKAAPPQPRKNHVKQQDTEGEEDDAAANEEKAERARTEALDTYETMKHDLARGLIRLYNTPTEQLVTQQISKRGATQSKPITVMMLPHHEREGHRLEAEDSISRNALDQEDAFCRSGQRKIEQLLEVLDKKLGMHQAIGEAQQAIMSEINELEARRSEAIKGLTAVLNNTPLTDENMPEIEKTLEALAEQATTVRRTAPTIKSRTLHFSAPTSEATRSPHHEQSSAERKKLAAGYGTSRWDVAQALKSLESKLTTYTHATRSPAGIPEPVSSLERLIQTTRKAWSPELIVAPDGAALPIIPQAPREARPEAPASGDIDSALKKQAGLSPAALQSLLQNIGGTTKK